MKYFMKSILRPTLMALILSVIPGTGTYAYDFYVDTNLNVWVTDASSAMDTRPIRDVVPELSLGPFQTYAVTTLTGAGSTNTTKGVWCSIYGLTPTLPRCGASAGASYLVADLFRVAPVKMTTSDRSAQNIWDADMSRSTGKNTFASGPIFNVPQPYEVCATVVVLTTNGDWLVYTSASCPRRSAGGTCSVTTPSTTIDFVTFNASELNPGRKKSTLVNIKCTGGGGTVNVSSNEYDNSGKKVIRNDGGDDLYAIVTANLNGGEKPVTPTGQPLTLLEGGNPLTIWADIRANEPQKHEGFFTNTSVITLTYQ
jgi:hypothetical protein